MKQKGYWTEKKLPQYMKDKIGKSMEGKVGYWRGKKRPRSTVLKITEALLRRGTSSKETCEKISISKMGSKNPNWNPNKKKYFCVDCNKKITAYCDRCWRCYLEYNIGENHHSFKPNKVNDLRRIRNSFRTRYWKAKVLNRDNHTCIWCGSRDNLHVDHIKPFALFPKLRFTVKNGRVLCFTCHKKTDTYGGKTRRIKNTYK